MRVFIIFSVLLFLSGFQKTKLQSNFEEFGLFKKHSKDEKAD